MKRLLDAPSTNTDRSLDAPQDELTWLGQLLDGKSAASQAGIGETSSAPPAVGLRIGRFGVESVLGSGGFGVVFRAFDPKLDRHVALKVLRPEAALSPRICRRFLREAKAAAQLEHPGIVSVYEVGRYAGLSYLAAPLCEGRDLAAWLVQHPGELTPVQTAMVVAKVAEAVHHAHVRGILHRDLKPSNILLRQAFGLSQLPFEPLLADFGLAGHVEHDGDETQHGTALGTVHYMSPEQAAARWNEVGVASDVFSLGVILYELLTGDRPFAGDERYVRQLLLSGARPTSPRRKQARMPVDLETICLKCLAGEPNQRYASAAELAADLRRFLGHQPILAHPPRLSKQIWLWCRRRPVVAALSFVLILTLTTSAVVTAGLYSRERAQRARAEEHLDVAREAVNKMYTKVADQWLIDQPQVQDLRLEFLEDALRFYERIVAQQPHDDRSRHELSVALHRMANMSSQIGRREAAIGYRERCLTIVDDLRSRFPDNEAYHYDAFMNRLMLGGESLGIERAAVTLGEAETIIRRLVSTHPENPIYRDALAALCNSLACCVEKADPEPQLREAAAIAEQLMREYPDRLLYGKHAAVAHMALAKRRIEEGKQAEAYAHCGKAQAVVDRAQRASPEAQWVDALTSEVSPIFGQYMLQEGNAAAALPLLERGKDALDRLINRYPLSPGNRHARGHLQIYLAETYEQLGRQADAIAALKNAEADGASALEADPNHPVALQVLENATKKLDVLLGLQAPR